MTPVFYYVLLCDVADQTKAIGIFPSWFEAENMRIQMIRNVVWPNGLVTRGINWRIDEAIFCDINQQADITRMSQAIRAMKFDNND